VLEIVGLRRDLLDRLRDLLRCLRRLLTRARPLVGRGRHLHRGRGDLPLHRYLALDRLTGQFSGMACMCFSLAIFQAADAK